MVLGEESSAICLLTDVEVCFYSPKTKSYCVDRYSYAFKSQTLIDKQFTKFSCGMGSESSNNANLTTFSIA